MVQIWNTQSLFLEVNSPAHPGLSYLPAPQLLFKLINIPSEHRLYMTPATHQGLTVGTATPNICAASRRNTIFISNPTKRQFVRYSSSIRSPDPARSISSCALTTASSGSGAGSFKIVLEWRSPPIVDAADPQREGKSAPRNLALGQEAADFNRRIFHHGKSPCTTAKTESTGLGG